MLIDVLIIIILTSFIQSIFGVGVLLFGTPLLLLRGYDFISALIILLPISALINLTQIIKDYQKVDFGFYKRFVFFTIPFVIVFLFFVTRIQINIGLLVGIFLLFVASKNYSVKVNNAIMYLVRYEKIYFIVMGIIHGLTNLGGSLLTAIIHSKEYEKHKTRVTIALSYATFALFQIVTLLVSGYKFDAKSMGNGYYLIAGFLIFILSERFVYMDINSNNYSRYFSVFLFFSGILLCLRSL